MTEPTAETLLGNEPGDEVPPLPEAKSQKGAMAPKASGKKSAQPVAAPAGEKMFTIILEESDEIPPTGQFVGVNGRTWMIRPGEPVTVPECVLEALNDAASSVPRTDQNGNILDFRDKQRLPYRLVTNRS